MAMIGVLEDKGSVSNKKKRKRMCKRTKFDVNEKVEVRSLKEGFMGSWHQGTVIARNKQEYRIKFDHLLVDNGSDNLVDIVPASPVVDGTGHLCEKECSYRGTIRPLPPKLEFVKWNLYYGLCVDVYFMEAWWEGVIFDYEDGSEKRTVFLPDLGDEMIVEISNLRITQDWDDHNELWLRRGAWLFLELIEQYAKEWYISVSVKQIWYDLREKERFQNCRDWTSSCEAFWKELVQEVIKDNHDTTVNHSLRVLGLHVSSQTKSKLESEPTIPAADVYTSSDANLADSVALVSGDQNCSSSLTRNEGRSSTDSNMDESKARSSRFIDSWKTAGPDLVPCAQSCPDAITEYVLAGKRNNPSITTDVRKHLLYQGWKIEFKREPRFVRLRYISPTGDCYYSLYQICLHLTKHSRDLICSSTKDVHVEPNDCPQPLLDWSEDRDMCTVESESCSQHQAVLDWSEDKDVCAIEPEYCPQAVLDSSKVSMDDIDKDHSWRSEISLKAKKHLSWLGWTFRYRNSNGRCYWCYTSPNGKTYLSLIAACRICIKECGVSQTDASHCRPTEKINGLSEDDSRLANEKLSAAVSNMNMLRTRKSKRKISDSCASRFAKRQACLAVKRTNDVCAVEPEFCPQPVLVWSDDKDVCTIEPEYCPQAVLDWSKFSMDDIDKDHSRRSDISLKAKKHLSWLGWTFRYRNSNGRCYWCYTSPNGKTYLSLLAACRICIKEGGVSQNDASCSRAAEKTNAVVSNMNILRTRKSKRMINDSFASHLEKRQAFLAVKGTSISSLKGGKTPVALIKLKEDLKGSQHKSVLRTTKRVQQVVTKSLSHQNPRTVLSWLIDNNVVLPRSKVYYWKKEKKLKARGRITRVGIKCSCCDKLYTLHGFGVHAGSSSRRPASHIFLEDGRSLLACQLQLIHNNKIKKFEKKQNCQLKGDCGQDKNDCICSICHYGGELILCDQCPSSFHKICVGLESVPDGDWFCPSCCCSICCQSKPEGDGANFLDDRSLTCAQCEHKYHVRCIQNRGEDGLDVCTKENWFCSKKCEEIFEGLHELLGRPIPVGTDNLTWTLIKYIDLDCHDLETSDNQALIENNSKLSIALDVMHECFEPVKSPGTDRDLAADIIFSRSSKLNRLNFHGFYTILLERHDELITVANVRILGEKVAELPLIGTRFQYRRLGMCRILMNELEKKLVELGVQRLILPAAPTVLHTWTNSFGFSKMTLSERLKFVDYTFLDFQGANMCQKLLLEKPCVESNITIDSQCKLHSDAFENSDSVNVDGSRAVSEVFPKGQTSENGCVEQGLQEADAGEGISSNGNCVDVMVTVNRQAQFDHESCDNEASPESSVVDTKFKEAKCGDDNFIRCYKRRTISGGE